MGVGFDEMKWLVASGVAAGWISGVAVSPERVDVGLILTAVAILTEAQGGKSRGGNIFSMIDPYRC